jgi:hypothetical protein
MDLVSSGSSSRSQLHAIIGGGTSQTPGPRYSARQVPGIPHRALDGMQQEILDHNTGRGLKLGLRQSGFIYPCVMLHSVRSVRNIYLVLVPWLFLTDAPPMMSYYAQRM